MDIFFACLASWRDKEGLEDYLAQRRKGRKEKELKLRDLRGSRRDLGFGPPNFYLAQSMS